MAAQVTARRNTRCGLPHRYTGILRRDAVAAQKRPLHNYRDDVNAPPVVIINERAANRFWPGENPIGKRIAISDRDGDRQDWLSIIGVVANASLDDMVSDPYSEIYLAAFQTPAFMGEGVGSGRLAHGLPHVSCA